MASAHELLATAAVVLLATGVLVAVWALRTSGEVERASEAPPPAGPVARPELEPTIPAVAGSSAGSLEPEDEGRYLRAGRGQPTRAVEAAARPFLKGYLRWSNGHGPASQLAPVDRALRVKLAARAPRLPGRRRTRDPGRVISLVSEPRAGAARARVLALVRDAEREYVLRLALERRAGRWQVVEVSG